MPIAKATLWTILGAYLILPMGTAVDLPLIPPLDKVTVPNLAAFAVCRFVLGKRVPLLPKTPSAQLLMLIYIVSPFITAMLNPDPLIAGPIFIQGMDAHDALSAVIRQQLFILPFLLGLRFFREAKDLENVLMVLAIAVVWYSLPMLFEVRMSPQLHTWIYGYFPHSFGQQMRDGGFRPVVFIGHGLWVAFFTMTGLVSAMALRRIRRSPLPQFSSGMVVAYIAIVLILCKSMASLIYAAFVGLFINFAKPRLQVRLALLLAVIAMTYPMSRGTGWFPVQDITDLATSVSAERAQSFQFRVRNEEMLLKKANARPWFGWGTWGRNRIYDPVSGKDISVTDGRWIQVIGQFGWVGFIAEFGLLALAVHKGARAISYSKAQRDQIVLGALTLLFGIEVIDLLPNNTMSPWTWLVAGVLIGRSEQILVEYKLSLKLKAASAQAV